jgi:hypothetical protein
VLGTDAFVRPADPERSEGACDSGKRTITGGSPRSFNPSTDRLTLTEIRRKILEQTNVFKPKDVIPVP